MDIKKFIIVLLITTLFSTYAVNVKLNSELQDVVEPNQMVNINLDVYDIKDIGYGNEIKIKTDLRNPTIEVYGDGNIFISKHSSNEVYIRYNDVKRYKYLTIKISGITPDWKIISSYSGGDIQSPKKVNIYKYTFNKDYKYYDITLNDEEIQGDSFKSFKIDNKEYSKLLNKIKDLDCSDNDKKYLINLLEKGLYEEAKNGVNHIGTKVEYNWTYVIVALILGIVVGGGVGFLLFKRDEDIDDDEIV